MATRPRSSWRPEQGERGGILVWSVFLLFVTGAFLALSMNVGHLTSARGELQNAADSAALAGAAQLDGTQAGVDGARTSSRAFSGLHVTDRATAVDIADADVIPGHWDVNTRQFTTPAASLFETNAVQVNVGREQARGNPLPMWLARAFLSNRPMDASAGARTAMDVRATAIAVGGGPCGDDCALPIVLPACLVMAGGALQCGQMLQFANDHTDNAGFTSLDMGNVGTATVTRILADIYRNGTCKSAGPQMRVENGNNINPVTDDFLCAMNRVEASGMHLSMPVVAENGVVDPFASCTNPRFNQTWSVVGFARVHICWATGANDCNSLPRRSTYCDGVTPLPDGVDRVYCARPSIQANCPGNPATYGGNRPTIQWNAACPPIPAQGLPCVPQRIYMSNECDQVQYTPQPVGCGFFGLESPRPQLVR